MIRIHGVYLYILSLIESFLHSMSSDENNDSQITQDSKELIQRFEAELSQKNQLIEADVEDVSDDERVIVHP